MRVFCISDLHGEWDLYMKAMETMDAIAGEEEWHCYCLGDVVDSVLGCGIILKNSIGLIGVIIVIGICITPIIKIATM